MCAFLNFICLYIQALLVRVALFRHVAATKHFRLNETMCCVLLTQVQKPSHLIAQSVKAPPIKPGTQVGVGCDCTVLATYRVTHEFVTGEVLLFRYENPSILKFCFRM